MLCCAHFDDDDDDDDIFVGLHGALHILVLFFLVLFFFFSSSFSSFFFECWEHAAATSPSSIPSPLHPSPPMSANTVRFSVNDHDSTQKLLVDSSTESERRELTSLRTVSKTSLVVVAVMCAALFGIASSSTNLAAFGMLENGSGQVSLATLGGEEGGNKSIDKRTGEGQKLSRNDFSNNEEKKTKSKMHEGEEEEQSGTLTKTYTRDSSLFNFYHKIVAPKLGDFRSFARDLIQDRPAAMTNNDSEREESERDYDDVFSGRFW